MTGAWSLGPLPLRAWRSTQAAFTRVGDRRAGQDQVDPHAEVLVEHAGPVVPVREDALVGPPVADDVVQPDRLELGQGLTLGRGHVGLADVGVRDRTRRRRSGAMFMSPQTTTSSGPSATTSRSAASQASL